ncbi:MAG: HEPN domain-containing protein [Terriglobia bacterium]
MKEKVALQLQTARENLIDAQVLLDGRRYPGVLNRAYYAVFYAATAMLLQAGLEFESHYGVKIKFGELFVKSGRVPVRFGKILTTAFDRREDADYTPEARSAITQSVAEQGFERASEFVTMAERFIEGTGGPIE